MSHEKLLQLQRFKKAQQLSSLLGGYIYTEEEVLAFLNNPENDPDLTHLNTLGRNAMHQATLRGFERVVKRLIEERGMDVHATAKGGVTALHYACKAGNEPLIHYLQTRGASMRAQDLLGETPLHYYARSPDTSKDIWPASLFGPGSDFDPNICDMRGNTALEYLCQERSSPFAWELARKGTLLTNSYFIADESDLGERLFEANRRWQHFWANPKAGNLMHDDLYHFANLGCLSDIFTPSLWRDHPAHLRTLFESLPLYLTEQVLAEQPGIVPMLVPTPAIQPWTAAIEPLQPVSPPRR